MKKLLLLVVLVLFMGACSTEPESAGREPYPPIIGPQLNLTKQNAVENWLEGEWKYPSTESKLVYKYSKDLGKQMLKYNGDGTLNQCVSYEIIENYFTDENQVKTHLLVYYIGEELVGTYNQPIYHEILEIDKDTYKMYMRTYRIKDKEEAFYMKDPKKTIRVELNGVIVEGDMKRVK